MDLIDEEDDASFALCHFVDDGLQSLFEFAFVLGASNQCAHIEGEELLVAQVLWHIAPENTVGKAFDDSRLTGTRFANQDRIVLRASAEDLQHASDLFVTSDHRVEFSCARFLYQITRIFREALVGVLAGL